MGRFLTRDPFPGFAFDPIGQHPYVYARNNPALYTNPSGYGIRETLDAIHHYLNQAFPGAMMGGTAEIILESAGGVARYTGKPFLGKALASAAPFASAVMSGLFQYLEDLSLCGLDVNQRMARATIAALEGLAFGAFLVLAFGPLGIPMAIVAGIGADALFSYVNERWLFPALGLSPGS